MTAAVPIAGAMAEGQAGRIAHVPIWIIHGAQNPVVPSRHAEVAFKALRDAGGEPTLTLYEDRKHNIWAHAATEPGLCDWLFAQLRRRHRPARPSLQHDPPRPPAADRAD